MDVKDRFKQIKLLEVKIKNKQDELKRLRSDLTSIHSQQGERVQTSPKDNTAEAVSKLIDLEKEIETEIRVLVNSRTEVIREIHELENPMYVDVLYRVYVKNESWRKIACDLGYSERSIQRFNGKALDILRKKEGGN